MGILCVYNTDPSLVTYSTTQWLCGQLEMVYYSPKKKYSTCTVYAGNIICRNTLRTYV